MAFCKACGDQLDGHSKFCHGCGAPTGSPAGAITDETRIVAAPPAPPPPPAAARPQPPAPPAAAAPAPPARMSSDQLAGWAALVFLICAAAAFGLAWFVL